MEFNESKTKENLAKSFAGASQDGARFQFVSKSAMSEGFAYISDLMKGFAKNKMAHASIFYQIMLTNIGTNKENINIEAGYPFEKYTLKTSLKDSAQIEQYQAKNVYPHFSKIAKDEGFAKIAEVFDKVASVNLENANKLLELAEKFEKKKLYKSDVKEKWICSNCGFTMQTKEAWKTCPLCEYPQGYAKITFKN